MIVPAGGFSRSGRDAGDASLSQFDLMLGISLLAGNGWFLRPSLGFAVNSLQLEGRTPAELASEKAAVGGTLGLAVGWDTPFDSNALGGSFRVGYAHFFKTEHDLLKVEMKQDYLSLTFDVAWSSY